MPKKNLVLEVEKKFQCTNLNSLISYAKKTGFHKTISTLIENDTYYSDKEQTFISKLICLRTRETDTNIEVTYKGESLVGDGFYSKIENNFTVSKEYKNNIKLLFNSLGFEQYVEVKKIRDTYTKDYENKIYNIVIDKIEGIGEFIEFEILIYDISHKDNARQELDLFIEQFNKFQLKEIVLPYRDLVKNFKKGLVNLQTKSFDINNLEKIEKPGFQDFWNYTIQESDPIISFQGTLNNNKQRFQGKIPIHTHPEYDENIFHLQGDYGHYNRKNLLTFNKILNIPSNTEHGGNADGIWISIKPNNYKYFDLKYTTNTHIIKYINDKNNELVILFGKEYSADIANKHISEIKLLIDVSTTGGNIYHINNNQLPHKINHNNFLIIGINQED